MQGMYSQIIMLKSCSVRSAETREPIIAMITAALVVWVMPIATYRTHLYITLTSRLIQAFRYEACVSPVLVSLFARSRSGI